jgi:hypothetical protein
LDSGLTNRSLGLIAAASPAAAKTSNSVNSPKPKLLLSLLNMTLLLRLSAGQSAGRYVRVPPALCSDVDNRVITGITLGGQDEAQSEDKSKPL